MAKIQYGSWSWTRHLTDPGTGTVYADQSGTNPCGFDVSPVRTSVDTGKFIPGVYRVNPYLVKKEEFASPFCNWTDSALRDGWLIEVVTYSGYPQTSWPQWHYSPSLTANIGNQPLRALQQALGKLSGGSVNMGESLGEIRETITMLRSPFKSLREFLSSNNFRNLGLWQSLVHYANSGSWVERGGNLLTGRKAAVVAANTWLEFRYGLMPLVYTIQDVIKLVNEASQRINPNVIRTVRGKTKGSVRFSSPYDPMREGAWGYTWVSQDTVAVDDFVCRAAVQYKVSVMPSLAQQLQLTPRFIPEVAWELTRLSFVVDWFFDVSAWLGTLRYEPEITILGNTVGTRVSRKVTTSARTKVSNNPSALYTDRGVISIYKCEFYQREVNLEPPPIPLFKPEFKSIKHVIDALALLIQPLLGKARKIHD